MSSIHRTLVGAEAKMHEDVFEAAQHGNIEAFESMEGDSSFDINLTGECSSTYLMGASNGGHPDLTKYLLDRGALIDKPDTEGLTALYFAVGCNKVEVMRVLLERGADPHINQPYDIQNVRPSDPHIQPYDKERFPFPLYRAAANNFSEACELLLKFGANLDAKFKGATSLQIAIQKKSTESIKVLQTATDKKKKQKNEAKSVTPDGNDKKLPPPTTTPPPISAADAAAAAEAAAMELLALEEAEEQAKLDKKAKNKSNKINAAKKKKELAD